jgi:hypothetical protein
MPRGGARRGAALRRDQGSKPGVKVAARGASGLMAHAGIASPGGGKSRQPPTAGGCSGRLDGRGREGAQLRCEGALAARPGARGVSLGETVVEAIHGPARPPPPGDPEQEGHPGGEPG